MACGSTLPRTTCATTHRCKAVCASGYRGRHVEFLQSLELSFESGDYLFVHAGVNPSCQLDQQIADDLLWIREPFLSCTRDLGRVVVHGHTVESEPVVRANRIGIDTGACWTGCLTCLVLEEREFRFLATGGKPYREWLGDSP